MNDAASAAKIVLNARESSSGSYTFFLEHVLKKQPYSAKAMSQPSTSQVADNVAADKGAIGYVGLGYLNDKIKTVKIKVDAKSPAVAPSLETVLNNTYPLARPLFEYTQGEPSGASKTWLDWVSGPGGQEIVKKLGFVPAK